MNVALPLSTQSSQGTIYIDSCAGVSVFSQAEYFIDLKAPQRPISVSFGPSEPILVSAVGTVAFVVSTDSNDTTIILNNICYVPQQHLNLLSINTLHKHGGGANFDDKPGHVRFNKNVSTKYSLNWQNNLPYVHAAPQKATKAACYAVRRAVPQDLQSRALHQRFCHIGTSKLKTLAKLGFIDPATAAGTKTLDCDDCMLANAHKEPYPSTDLRATQANDVLHADVLYMPARTLDGKEYVLVAIDEYTRYAFVALLRTKAEAGPELLSIFKRAATLHDRNVKHLRTDLGGEFTSTLMQTAKEQLGISDQHVSAECHASNGLVERVLKTLQEMVRSVMQSSKFPPSFWGELLLASVHVYNLLPHKALTEHKSPIPLQLYLSETDDRLQRLYNQLVPLGIQCLVVDIQSKSKLDARSYLGYITGYGPSTQQYRVILQKDATTLRHIIARHVTITGAHHKELFARTQSPFQVPSNCATRTYHPGMTDIYVGVLSKTMHAAQGRQIQIFHPLLHECVFAGVTAPTSNVSEGHAEPAQFDIETSMFQGTALDINKQRNSVERAEVFKFLVTHIMPNFMTDENKLSEREIEVQRALQGTKRQVEDQNPSCSGVHKVPKMEAKTQVSTPTSQAFSWLDKDSNPDDGVESAPKENHCQDFDTFVPDEFGTLPDGFIDPLDLDFDGYASTKSGVTHKVQPTCSASHEVQTPTGALIVEDTGNIQVLSTEALTDDPTAEAAMASSSRLKWIASMQEELSSMLENAVYTLVDRPKNTNVVKCKWVLKIKRNKDNSIDKHKARLVAKGFSQQKGIDYHELWAPTGHHATLRSLFMYALVHGHSVRHIDIKCAFLNGDLEEIVYMEQPPYFHDGTNKVWKLNKSIYGLKQASRQWHKKLKGVLNKCGFVRASYDPALFVDKETHKVLLFMWVDDLFIAASDRDSERLIGTILEEFQGRDLGEAAWLLGMEAKHSKNKGILQLSQRRMIKDMLSRFSIPPNSVKHTPMEQNFLSNYEKVVLSGQHKVVSTENKCRYMQMVGSLNYIATVTRPDISYAVGVLARFMNEPTEHLLKAATRVMKYLATTAEHSLVFRKTNAGPMLSAFSDSDYANDEGPRRSTTGSVVMFNGGCVFWRSKRQPIVSVSSTEAEMIALTATALELEWLKRVLNEDMRYATGLPLIFCDNESTIKLAQNPIASARTRHIDVRHRKIQQFIEDEHMQLKWVSTSKQLADILTKSLPRSEFEGLRDAIGVAPFMDC